jgi:putative hydrolase of the HAD superfamily
MKATAITCLFLDIGGVLLTNGWDHHARKRAATNFKVESAEMEERHHLTFDTYEEGKLTLEEYLSWVVLTCPRLMYQVLS